MRLPWPLIAAMVAPGLALALWLALGAVGFYATLDAPAAAALAAALGPLLETHGMLVLFWWLVAASVGAWAVQVLHERYMAAPARLAEGARVLVSDASAPPVAAGGDAAARTIADALNALSQERRTLKQEMARLVEDASHAVAHQRDQLGALVAELQQSVVVCNLEGRILLYNARARALCRRISRAPGGAGGAELIGLGRSIHGVVDKALIDHARESVDRRIVRGEPAPSARFVTHTPSGHLLRVSLAPVREAAEGAPATGYVLLLDDITEEYEAEAHADRQWLTLTETSRAGLASIQAALDMLDYPDLETEERERFQAVVREEVAAMGERITALAAEASSASKARWPLQDMLGADLIAAASHHIAEATGLAVTADTVEGELWLSVDSFSLIAALTFLARCAVEGREAPDLELRVSRADGRAHLDLCFAGGAAIAAGWQSSPMDGAGGGSPLSVRDVAERHGGEVWLEHARTGGTPRAVFRFLLPLASAAADTAAHAGESRPEFYDFDLFAASEGHHERDDRPLGELAFTVFDTETTGLDPAGGDEIIQIGATRIVNGKLLKAECFDQLVNPGRSIPEAGIAIHGIRPAMVRGQPAIGEVLPAFHAFVSDTVLVGHNVAFDLRFLKLKEAATGVVFDQPVLDTLLLASIVHPNAEAQSLEAIAARLGITVSGRHTALGDALACAEVFMKLLPLLQQQGIRTLGEARAASEDSYYARLRY
ncbi:MULTISPECIES: exonuclease domain-containing protein [unclassified Xanthobacter]|uniref:3'-5' exonuclease n=1 Tax=unclassified Xanthobacter TaxID=2623496 RepID=UPI001F3DDD35|nr:MULTISPECIES: exonuclease domain-containing protein [unclassified Xanthobacter]